jgi:hypothetical protein
MENEMEMGDGAQRAFFKRGGRRHRRAPRLVPDGNTNLD